MINKINGFFKRSELMAALGLFKRELIIVSLLSMVANVLMLSPTLYMLQVFDRVLVSQSELTLLALSLIALFLYMVMAFAEWMRSRVLIIAGIRFDDRLSSRVFDASFDAQLNPTGIASSRAVGDLMQLRQFLTGNGIFAFFDIPWVPVYIFVLYVLHPWLGVMAIVFSVIQAALAWWAHWCTVRLTQAANQASTEDYAYLQSKLRNAETLESMGMVNNLLHHWRERHDHYLTKSSEAHTVATRVSAVSKFVRYTQQSLALGLGGLLVIDGQISAGAMIAANVLTSRALAPIDMLVGVWRSFLETKEAFIRLEGLLSQYPRRKGITHNKSPRGYVQVVDLVATAPGRNKPILDRISLEFTPGTMTVVMGASGAGKSTLARAILGIWPHVQGAVLLDGAPILNWDRLELGPYLGYLPQDIELFEGTIAENITRFSKLESAKVIEAAKNTGLHAMILRLPKGYDTPIGEAGSILSGGQRQRIGLARAVYGKPSLVVLDEPNANLDDAGEAALMKAVHNLKMDGKTVILVTHRPAALSAADQVVILQDGRISMVGPRDTVLLAIHNAKNPINLRDASSSAGAVAA